MKTRVKKIIAGNSGQAMVEFALVAALFFGLLFGAVEFGRLWYYSAHLGNSVRAAARYGAVLTDPGQAPAQAGNIVASTQDYARAEITGTATKRYLPATGIASVRTTIYDRDNNPVTSGAAAHGDTIRVTAVYNFRVLPGTLIPGFSGVLPLTREASANYE
jgi:Flp pilus assembly protein TadG